jgi:hypothetical protein
LTSSTGLSRWIANPSHLGSRRAELRFTVHRPARAKVSRCCHRPSGGDVAGGVDISIARPCTAGDALENCLALTVFRRDMPAVGASLRCVRCRCEFEPARGLVLQACSQQSPPLAADLAVEAPFLRNVGARAFTLHGHIPHKPGMATVFGQCGRLLTGGKQPKPTHSNNISPTTDNQSKEGRRRFIPG